MKKTLTTAMLAVALAIASSAASGGPAEDPLSQARATEINLLRALVEQGVITAEKARQMLEQAGIDPNLLTAPILPVAPTALPAAPASAPAASAPPGTVIVNEATKREIMEQVRQEVQAQARAENRGEESTLPAWVRRISFGGDVRLRFIRDDFASDNGQDSLLSAGTATVPIGSTVAATLINNWYQLPQGAIPSVLDSHEYFQLRARLNVESVISAQFRGGVQLTTVSGDDATSDPVDFDVNMGRYSRPYSAAVSLGYLQWLPRDDVVVTGGRMINPYFKSDLIFAQDFDLDGVAASFSPRFGGGFGASVTAGAHPLQTSQSGPFNAASDQVLYALQAGADWLGVNESHGRVAIAYYNFAGIQAKPDPQYPANNTLYDDSAPLFRQFGNTMFNIRYQVVNDTSTPIAPLYGYAAQFRLINLGGEYEYAGLDPLRLGLQIDWVRNLGFNAAEIYQRLGTAVQTLPSIITPSGALRNGVNDPRIGGYLVSAHMGAPRLRRFGDWQVFGGVRYLERDAVPDAFTSPDYRLGGTDNQAQFVGVNLGLSRATSLSLRYISARSIDSGPKFSVDSWFLDFNGRF